MKGYKQQADRPHRKKMLVVIVNKYIVEDSPNEVNLSGMKHTLEFVDDHVFGSLLPEEHAGCGH